MASFNLQWRTSTKKDLRRIPRDAISRIVAEVAKLADEPLFTDDIQPRCATLRSAINSEPSTAPAMKISYDPEVDALSITFREMIHRFNGSTFQRIPRLLPKSWMRKSALAGSKPCAGWSWKGSALEPL